MSRKGTRALSSRIAVCTVAVVAAAGCPKSTAPSDRPTVDKAAPDKQPVSVLYAGSLVSLMEKDLGPAFERATGYPFRGEGRGSTALANMINEKLRTPDVFISASSKVNERLMGTDNGNMVSWYAVVFGNEMVLAYSEKSAFAPRLAQVKAGSTPFYEVLQLPGLKLGRTDPALDPKGYRTLLLFDLASGFYRQPGLRQKLLGADDNPAQVFPEEQLVARLDTGQIDAGIFYRNEAAERGLPYATLPREINLSDPAMSDRYEKATWTDAKGKTLRGSAIVYTVTIPSTAKNTAGAEAFVRFMLSADGRKLLDSHGLPPVAPAVKGDPAAVPASLRPVVGVSAAVSP